MKQHFNYERLAARIGVILTVLFIITASIISYGFNEKTIDLWKQLGIEQSTANKNIEESFIGGYLKYYGARNIKNIAEADKRMITQNLLTYTKQYMNTQFKTVYAKERLSFKPREPQLKPLRTREQIQKEEVDKLEANIKKTETEMKTMTDDMKKIFGPVIEQNKKMLAEYKKPGNELFEILAQGEKLEQERQIANNKQALKDWELTYPEDYKLIINERLKKILELTKDVDFDAKLKEVNGKKRFVNPAYEAKRSGWKMAFRAGKEVTELTRSFAEQWLNELK